MATKFVLESLEKRKEYGQQEEERLKLREEFPILKTYQYAIIANALQMMPRGVMVQNKLNYENFYNYIKDRGFGGTSIKMKSILQDASQFLKLPGARKKGISSILSLSKEMKAELRFKEKVMNDELDIRIFIDAEIDEIYKNEDDYVVRSMYPDTEIAYYRFTDEKDNPRTLRPHEINMLRAAYSSEYGNPDKSNYRNYLDARPIIIKNQEKWGRGLESTRGENWVD